MNPQRREFAEQHKDFRVNVPEGKDGIWEVRRREMNQRDAMISSAMGVVTYARANAPLKHVLINGLGIGVAIELLAPYVEHFTIIELSNSVIRLVAPHYHARYPGRVEVIGDNALTYRPPKGVRYDAVFHDIWDFISHKNLVDMRLLHRRYGRLCNWQASWARNYCERDARKRKLHPEQYKNEVGVKEVMRSLNILWAITGD